jgi:hypothetical protein
MGCGVERVSKVISSFESGDFSDSDPLCAARGSAERKDAISKAW